MFNPEQAIAEWRKQMLAAGIKTPVPLEELESHLREDAERQMSSGLGAQQAFEIAIKRIGQADALKSEFKKNKQKRQSVISAAATLGLGLAFFIAGACSWHTFLPTGSALEILGGIILAVSAGRDIVHVIQSRRHRKIV